MTLEYVNLTSKIMKNIFIVLLVVVIVAFGGINYLNTHQKPMTVKAPEQKTVTETVIEDALEKQIQEAITASSTDTENKAKKAYDDAKHQAEVEIKLAVTTKYRTQIEAKEKALQAESKAY